MTTMHASMLVQRVKMVKFLRGSFMLKITQVMRKNRARLGKLAAHENVDGRRRNYDCGARVLCVRRCAHHQSISLSSSSPP
jgi:hypothetical protein